MDEAVALGRVQDIALPLVITGMVTLRTVRAIQSHLVEHLVLFWGECMVLELSGERDDGR